MVGTTTNRYFYLEAAPEQKRSAVITTNDDDDSEKGWIEFNSFLSSFSAAAAVARQDFFWALLNFLACSLLFLSMTKKRENGERDVIVRMVSWIPEGSCKFFPPKNSFPVMCTYSWQREVEKMLGVGGWGGVGHSEGSKLARVTFRAVAPSSPLP